MTSPKPDEREVQRFDWVSVDRLGFQEDGQWVQWNDYARLAAERERLVKTAAKIAVERDELRAEVEQLTKDFGFQHDKCAELTVEVERLRADGERYRKALLQILRIHERHVPEATGRKIADFREAMPVARAAIDAARSGEGE